MTEARSATTSDQGRCPNPYGDEGTGWTPKAWPDEQTVRAMNGRHGLLCTERTGREQQTADGSERLWGCVNQRGGTVVPFVYSRIDEVPFYFAPSGLALVFSPDEGWWYIDVANQKFGQALTLDNSPDEAFGGYARFRGRNGMIGYLDQNRHIAIPARYAAALPFANCTAQVCVGCHPDRWKKDAAEETECTGEAFIIDQSGKKLPDKLPRDADYCARKRASTVHQ